MSYPEPTPESLETFRTHGWLAVEDAIPHEDLDEIGRRCARIIDEKETLAYD